MSQCVLAKWDSFKLNVIITLCNAVYLFLRSFNNGV